MLFSSSIFIFIYLPAVLLVYYALKFSRTMQNVFLCAASLFFYAWGEPAFVWIMVLSICVNWLFGLLAEHFRESRGIRCIIGLDAVLNLSLLFVFKYLNFTVSNIDRWTGASLRVPDIALPIGISFFTFQAMSYVIDVYRGHGAAQKNILNVGLYISFFPQLIAGPIVRYETIADQIRNRRESVQGFADGVTRFILGLGKKVIIANNMAVIADAAFGISTGSTDWFGAAVPLSPAMAWIGALAYTFQIYFDFSGYSDMAIGLGRMFGFQFLENFNYPYISTSITEFWRRWHISLSSWFRDYVYIPLGGSRVKTERRHIFNLFVVWLLTGIWHGANWTFIVWGLLYFVLLVIEKSLGLHRKPRYRWLNAPKYVVTMFFVIIAWVIFRADSLPDAWNYIAQMLAAPGGTSDAAAAGGMRIGNILTLDDPSLFYLRQYAVFWALAVLCSFPVAPKLHAFFHRKKTYVGRHTRTGTAYTNGVPGAAADKTGYKDTQKPDPERRNLVNGGAGAAPAILNEAAGSGAEKSRSNGRRPPRTAYNGASVAAVVYDAASFTLIIGILLVSVSYIVTGSYNPFIYFNF